LGFGAYVNILDIHLPIPQSGKLVEDLSRLLVFDYSSDGVISAREVSLGLELDIGHEVVLGTTHVAVIAKLVLHFSKEDAARIHIGLGHDAGCVSS
jgi:hypothetical protein